MKQRNIKSLTCLGTALLLGTAVVGCSSETPEAGSTVTAAASALLSPASGSSVQGNVVFTAYGESVSVDVAISGLTPGDHGFHIHETGDCSSPDAKSAGGHFNPHGATHGAPDSDKRHVGDLGNITADANGKVTVKIEDQQLQLSGPASIIGRAVVVHAGADDLSSQPSGAAGKRVACGVIQ